jgi:hypothetical protein
MTCELDMKESGTNYPGIHVATQGLHLLTRQRLVSVGVAEPSKMNSTLSPLLATTLLA